MTERAVVVTGMGVVSALGTGVDAHRAALWSGRSGIRRVARFATEKLSTHLGAFWPHWDGRTQPEPSEKSDFVATADAFLLREMAIVAAREAWSSAPSETDPRRAALVFGTCFGQSFRDFSGVAEQIARALRLGGPCLTISTACASSANAIGLARDLLVHGHADVVVAGGADSLLREAFAGFSALGVLSETPCAPFSETPGTTLGEGAGFMVLEREADAGKRNATMWGAIHGYGLSADGFHETTPHPAGEGVARALRGALRDAEWRGSDVDFVSAHATGTLNNDRIEWSVIAQELARSSGLPAVAGSKGHIGHTQGAAGVLELCLALLCHREGHAPPTLHFRGARPGCPPDPIAQDRPRPLRVARALKLSAAFGGANAAIAYSPSPASRSADAPRTSRSRSDVVVSGAGVVGPNCARRLADVLDLLLRPGTPSSKAVDLDRIGVDARRLDPSARWLTAAAGLALSVSANREPLDRTGLFVGATRMPRQSSKRCIDSIRQRGVAGTSASAFARMSVNAPTGACSQALGLLGPTSTLSIGEGSGLLAIALAAEWLAWRDDAASMIAGGVDEASPSSSDEAEGAACLLLTQSRATTAESVLLTGWGIAGPDSIHQAIERAIAGGRGVDAVIADVGTAAAPRLKEWLTPEAPIGLIEAGSLWGEAAATRSSVTAAVGASLLAAQRADSALIVAGRGASTVALVMRRSAVQ